VFLFTIYQRIVPEGVGCDKKQSIKSWRRTIHRRDQATFARSHGGFRLVSARPTLGSAAERRARAAAGVVGAGVVFQMLGYFYTAFAQA
jgi:hypothetical protein